MKNILVATDFSPTAYLAAVYAAKLARHTGARLVLLHVFCLSEPGVMWDDDVAPEHQAQEKLDALAHELHTKYGVSITRLLKPGFVSDEILALADRVKADVVALGTCHQPGIAAGKTVAALLARSCFPVLCVPAGAVINPLTGIALFQEEDAQAVSVAELLRLYNPEVTIVQRKHAAVAALVPHSGIAVGAQQKAL